MSKFKVGDKVMMSDAAICEPITGVVISTTLHPDTPITARFTYKGRYSDMELDIIFTEDGKRLGHPYTVLTKIEDKDHEQIYRVKFEAFTPWLAGSYISKYDQLGISDLLMALYENGGSWDGWELYDRDIDRWIPCLEWDNPFSGLEFRMSDRPWATYSKNFKGE